MKAKTNTKNWILKKKYWTNNVLYGFNVQFYPLMWWFCVICEGQQPNLKLRTIPESHVFSPVDLKPISIQFPIWIFNHHATPSLTTSLVLSDSQSPKYRTPQQRLNFTLQDFTRRAHRMASGNRASQRAGGRHEWKRDLEMPLCLHGILRTIKVERD